MPLPRSNTARRVGIVRIVVAETCRSPIPHSRYSFLVEVVAKGAHARKVDARERIRSNPSSPSFSCSNT